MDTVVFERQAPSQKVVEHSLRGSRLSVFWLDDVERPVYPKISADTTTDLAVVGGGYAGLWTAIRAKEREPNRRVLLLESHRVGWAASGRNGGFCEASLTHGYDNGASRWPAEMPLLEQWGHENLEAIATTVETNELAVDLEKTGVLKLATEPHQIPWVRDGDHDEHHVYLDESAVRAQVSSPTYLAGLWDKRGNMLVHPVKLAFELARYATRLGVEIFEESRVTALRREGSGMTVTVSGEKTVRAQQVAVATNVFPSLVKRTRLLTVPVYDYVLASEPLNAEQLASIGWDARQGLADLANQFHYYRLTSDNRIVFGGYDAVYHAGGRIRPEYENRPETFRKLASHFFTTFPQLEGLRFTHTWGGVIDTCSRFCAYFGTAHGGRVAYSAGFTGLGVGATRFAGDVMLDLLGGTPTPRTELEMVRKRPIPFPPEPLASVGVGMTKWSLDRADHNGGRRNMLLRTLDAVGMGFDS